MNLKALLESGLLTAESKEVIEEQFNAALATKEQELKEGFEAQLVEEKAAMLEAVQEITQEAIAEEIEGLVEEVKQARSLEVTYAEKLETFKESYQVAQEEQMKVLVAESIAEEMEAIAEDVEAVKKHEFVMEMFESFKGAYEKLFGTADVNVYDELQEAKTELDQMKREAKIAELLENVQGSKRKVAETILEGVATDNLEYKFESIKAVLLAEAKQEEAPLTEGAAKSTDDVQGTVILENQEAPVDGEEDGEKVLEEGTEDPIAAKLRRSLKFAQGF